MVITPNPFTDVVSRSIIDRMGAKIRMELSVYKGHDIPSVSQLRQTENALRKIFYSSLVDIGQYSLLKGCNEIGIQIVPVNLKLDLIHTCKDRAQFAAESITRTTGVAVGALHAALSKKKALGKKRSKSDAEYEGSRIFFEQRTKAWRLKAGLLKAWYCADAPCDICQDNEDDGKIPMDQPFSSGDMFAPAHIICMCLNSLIL